ncbi:MAG TPA: hypothetical protein VGM83_15800 [Devosiaceae bacterium]|jgi:hypothetical protein
MTTPAAHERHAEALEEAVFRAPALTPPELRQQVGARASGGVAIAAPYDALARQIGEAAYGVTDAQVAEVLAATGSQKAAFEIVAAAGVGAALRRWKAGLGALREASDAAR